MKNAVFALILALSLMVLPTGKAESVTLSDDETCPSVEADTQAATVDVYQDMESGHAGDLLTPDIMNASSHGGSSEITATWSTIGSMWVSTDHAKSLPSAVRVGGTEYNVSSTRTWKFSDKYESNYVQLDFGSNQWGAPYHDRMTVAGYFTPGPTRPVWNTHDNIVISGNESFGVLQTVKFGADAPLQLRAHSCTQPGWATTFSPGIDVAAGKTYWVNLHYDGVAGKVKVAVFDPDNGWAQVGETVEADSVPDSDVKSLAKFGRCSPHGDHTSWPNETYSYFGHILVDYTIAAFPLLPDIPTLALHGASGDGAIHLDWTVAGELPSTATWHIDYYTQTASVYTATAPLSTTRSAVLTDRVHNYQWYTVTLHTMDGPTSILSDTVHVMPTDRFVYLPLVLRGD
ncbi:MAG: hypothetical protein JW918_20530 [Anaerolineae bacterium]|nr:hypothetical protein [Anaerolineae bacterium]